MNNNFIAIDGDVFLASVENFIKDIRLFQNNLSFIPQEKLSILIFNLSTAKQIIESIEKDYLKLYA